MVWWWWVEQGTRDFIFAPLPLYPRLGCEKSWGKLTTVCNLVCLALSCATAGREDTCTVCTFFYRVALSHPICPENFDSRLLVIIITILPKKNIEKKISLICYFQKKKNTFYLFFLFDLSFIRICLLPVGLFPGAIV